MLEMITKQQRWFYLLWWVGASTISGAVGTVTGGYCSLIIGYLIGDPNNQTDNLLDLVFIAIMVIIGGIMGGVVSGLLHWILMRRSFRYIYPWLFRCAIFGAIAWLFVLSLIVVGMTIRLWNPFSHFTISLALVGALLGSTFALLVGDRPPKIGV